MPKRLSILLAGIMILALSCATMPRTPKQTYLAARTVFNDALESYITQKAMASPHAQIKWEIEIEPIFRDAQFALNIWGVAVHTPGMSVAEKQAAYDKIGLRLFQPLLRYGILEVTNE